MNPHNDGTAEGVQVATMLIVMLLILGVMLYHSPAEGQAGAMEMTKTLGAGSKSDPRFSMMRGPWGY